MTPCVKKCSAKDGACTGCGRTLDEIARWGRMTPAEREAVMTRLQDASTPPAEYIQKMMDYARQLIIDAMPGSLNWLDDSVDWLDRYDEIARWHKMTPEEREAVIHRPTNPSMRKSK